MQRSIFATFRGSGNKARRWMLGAVLGGLGALTIAAVPPPPECGFENATWEAVGVVRSVQAVGPLQTAGTPECGSTRQKTEVLVEWEQVLKGPDTAFFHVPWKYIYTAESIVGDCTGGYTIDFKTGARYRISFHEDANHTPRYCNQYLVKRLDSANALTDAHDATVPTDTPTTTVELPPTTDQPPVPTTADTQSLPTTTTEPAANAGNGCALRVGKE